jgi:hypothetical protein
VNPGRRVPLRVSAARSGRGACIRPAHILTRVGAAILVVLALLVSLAYVEGEFRLAWAALMLALDALLADVSPSIRRLPLQDWVRRVCLAGALIWIAVWMSSLCAYIRVPYTSSSAWGVGGGNLFHHSGPDTATNVLPLTFEAVWNGFTFTAGDLGMTSYFAGRAPGRASITKTWPTLPFLLALLIPTGVLWWLGPQHFPPGCCKTCGYNLTGNVSGRCPECGKPTSAVHDDARAGG